MFIENRKSTSNMKNLTWRLSKLPTPSELTELVVNKIITTEEAKEILVKVETDEERDSDSLKEEIKFLKKLVESLSQNKQSVITEYIYKYLPSGSWVQPYTVWCGSAGGTTNLTNAVYTSTSGGTYLASGTNFSDISTF